MISLAKEIEIYWTRYDDKYLYLLNFSGKTLFEQYVKLPGCSANFESLDIDLSGFSVDDRDQL
jgi:hypothetical protein